MAKTIARIQSPYNRFAIEQTNEGVVELVVEGAVYATYDPARYFTGYSWDGLSAACLLFPGGAPSSVLVLGLGGGTVCRQLRKLLPDVELTGVEIDAKIAQAAQEYMALGAQDVEVIIDDAYAYLEKETRHFDVVIDDLYLTGAFDVERPKTPTGSVLTKLMARTTETGLVVANLIVDEGHFAVQRAARRAFQKSFFSARVVRPPRGLNEIIVGGCGEIGLAPSQTLRTYAEELSGKDRRIFEAIKLTYLPTSRRARNLA